MGHRQGESRQQAALFPVMLDELVEEDSLVRVIDAWVAALEMAALGFAKAQPQTMGTPPYDPADLLKLYIWGYLGSVRSSRALERVCRRNVECMWLLGRLAPDHKTIAEFRRCHPQPLVTVCAAFVEFARAQRLIAGSTVAIDGSKIRAVASRKAVLGQRELLEQERRNAEEIERYLKTLDAQDRGEAGVAGGNVSEALKELQRRRGEIQAQLQHLANTGASTLVKGEPQARVMRSLHGAPAYNLQTAVETGSHMIVAHQVTSESNDERQLAPMTEAATQALQAPCTVVADAGYANGEHLAQLQAKGITAYVAPNRAINNQAEGKLYDKATFTYDVASDSFTCPAGKRLGRKQLDKRDKLVIYAAQKDDCLRCPQKPQCTTAERRFVSRHLYEDALQANAQRVAANPAMMALRRQTVEHPFDFIKHRVLGNARLLLRGKAGAQAELSLAILAYNLKRAFNMKGATWMRMAMGA
jgi:transposase